MLTGGLWRRVSSCSSTGCLRANTLRIIRPFPIRRTRGFPFRPLYKSGRIVAHHSAGRSTDINMYTVEVYHRGNSKSPLSTSIKRRSVSRTSRLTVGPPRGLELPQSRLPSFKGASQWQRRQMCRSWGHDTLLDTTTRRCIP